MPLSGVALSVPEILQSHEQAWMFVGKGPRMHSCDQVILESVHMQSHGIKFNTLVG